MSTSLLTSALGLAKPIITVAEFSRATGVPSDQAAQLMLALHQEDIKNIALQYIAQGYTVSVTGSIARPSMFVKKFPSEADGTKYLESLGSALKGGSVTLHAIVSVAAVEGLSQCELISRKASALVGDAFASRSLSGTDAQDAWHVNPNLKIHGVHYPTLSRQATIEKSMSSGELTARTLSAVAEPKRKVETPAPTKQEPIKQVQQPVAPPVISPAPVSAPAPSSVQQSSAPVPASSVSAEPAVSTPQPPTPQPAPPRSAPPPKNKQPSIFDKMMTAQKRSRPEGPDSQVEEITEEPLKKVAAVEAKPTAVGTANKPTAAQQHSATKEKAATAAAATKKKEVKASKDSGNNLAKLAKKAAKGTDPATTLTKAKAVSKVVMDDEDNEADDAVDSDDERSRNERSQFLREAASYEKSSSHSGVHEEEQNVEEEEDVVPVQDDGFVLCAETPLVLRDPVKKGTKRGRDEPAPVSSHRTTTAAASSSLTSSPSKKSGSNNNNTLNKGITTQTCDGSKVFRQFFNPQLVLFQKQFERVHETKCVQQDGEYIFSDVVVYKHKETGETLDVAEYERRQAEIRAEESAKAAAEEKQEVQPVQVSSSSQQAEKEEVKPSADNKKHVSPPAKTLFDFMPKKAKA